MSLGRLHTILGFHVRMAAAAIYRDFAAAMAPLDLTQKQFAVLELIAANQGVSQIEIATALDTDRATVMALVDRLEARLLVRREPSTVDRRKQALSLSEDGRQLLDMARARVAAHESRMTSTFGPDDAQNLTRLLQRLYRQP